jgi:dTDP-4-amino-4,6-dideoxy-D-glucose acyltransferase
MTSTPQYDCRLLKSYGEDIFISANVEFRRLHLVSIGSHISIDSGVCINVVYSRV